ncbi:type II toxin-antitoxin system Phd/YefM family antitoxin [Burkholderia sp. PU8-34]
MRTVNMPQAKSSLFRLVEAIEQGREREILITRKGRAVAKLVPAGKRLGIAKGVFEVPDTIDEHNDQIFKCISRNLI